MPVDSELLERAEVVCRKLPQGKVRAAAINRLDELKEQYETASLLSRGKDPQRSAHWLEQCKALERRIKLFVQFNGDDQLIKSRISA